MTTPSHGMRRHRNWRNIGHAPRVGSTARAAVHDCRHNEKRARRWCPFVPYSARYHFGTLSNRSTPRAACECAQLRRHSPAHRALAPPVLAAPCRDLRRRRWLVNQARLLPGADVPAMRPSPGADVAAALLVPVQTWQRRAQSRSRCGSAPPCTNSAMRAAAAAGATPQFRSVTATKSWSACDIAV